MIKRNACAKFAVKIPLKSVLIMVGSLSSLIDYSSCHIFAFPFSVMNLRNMDDE
jgi:hypothetical protein